MKANSTATPAIPPDSTGRAAIGAPTSVSKAAEPPISRAETLGRATRLPVVLRGDGAFLAGIGQGYDLVIGGLKFGDSSRAVEGNPDADRGAAPEFTGDLHGAAMQLAQRLHQR